MPTRMRSTMSTWTTRVHECRYTIWWPGNCFSFCVRLNQLLHAIPIASTKKLVPFWPMTIICLNQYYRAKIALFARRIAPFANIKQLPTFAFSGPFCNHLCIFSKRLDKGMKNFAPLITSLWFGTEVKDWLTWLSFYWLSCHRLDKDLEVILRVVQQ